MKKIFLTGVSSYLGSRFTELYKNEFEIHGLSRQDPNHPCDLKDFVEVAELFYAFSPDFIIHLAADLGRDSKKDDTILETNPAITKHLVELATSGNIPIIFTSTEAVYGGKWEEGGYVEEDKLEPRSVYGKSKVLSEEIIRGSDLPYFITRGHRYVGFNQNYNRPKQFPDTIKALLAGETVHLDSNKIFTPTHIDHIAQVIKHYIENHSQEQITVNVGTDYPVTFYDFICDIAEQLTLDTELIKSDGEEVGWPNNSSLKMNKLKKLGFPYTDYRELIDKITNNYKD